MWGVFPTPEVFGPTIAATSTVALALDPERIYASFSNPTDTDVWLNCGAPAEKGKGWLLPKAGGFREFKVRLEADKWIRAAWYAITDSGSKAIACASVKSSSV